MLHYPCGFVNLNLESPCMGSNSFCKKTNVRITDKMLHFTFNRCDQNDSSSKYVTLTILGGGAK